MIVSLAYNVLGFTLAVSGATGGLGRELCRQSVDRGWTTLALTRNSSATIYEPSRNPCIQKKNSEIKSSDLNVIHYDDAIASGLKYDALVLALGGKPFREDSTTRVVESICANLPQGCKCVCLLSAFGVGPSLKDASIGIKVMEAWYLRDVYSSKRKQEALVRELRNRDIQTLILRPRALSYGQITPLDTPLPRQWLAESILDWCELGIYTLR